MSRGRKVDVLVGGYQASRINRSSPGLVPERISCPGIDGNQRYFLSAPTPRCDYLISPYRQVGNDARTRFMLPQYFSALGIKTMDAEFGCQEYFAIVRTGKYRGDSLRKKGPIEPAIL